MRSGSTRTAARGLATSSVSSGSTHTVARAVVEWRRAPFAVEPPAVGATARSERASADWWRRARITPESAQSGRYKSSALGEVVLPYAPVATPTALTASRRKTATATCPRRGGDARDGTGAHDKVAVSAPTRRGCTTGTQMPRARPTCIKSSRLLSITAESWRRAHYHFTRAALFAVLDGSWLDSGHTCTSLLSLVVRTQCTGLCATQACSSPPHRRALPLCGRDHRVNTLPSACYSTAHQRWLVFVNSGVSETRGVRSHY